MKKIKNIFKKNVKLVIGLVIGLAVSGTIFVYADTILYNGTQVSYDNTDVAIEKSAGVNVANVQEAIEALYQKAENAGPPCALKLGDYFWLTPDVTSFTVTKASTGYSSDQTIKIAGSSASDGLRLWRVIDIHKDGSFDAVSEYVSDDKVYFQSATGYQYFVSTLQMIAGQYAKSGYTISTRMMGYNGQTPVIQTYSDVTACTNDATCKTTTTYAFDESTNDEPQSSSPSSPTSGTGQEYLKGVGGDTLYLKDYLLVSNVYKTDTTTYGSNGLKAYKVGTTTYEYYWLASRRFRFTSASRFGFGGRYIYNTSGGLSSDDLRYCYSGWYYKSIGCSFRPIITLKSGITVSGGTGEKGSPYTLS